MEFNWIDENFVPLAQTKEPNAQVNLSTFFFCIPPKHKF